MIRTSFRRILFFYNWTSSTVDKYLVNDVFVIAVNDIRWCSEKTMTDKRCVDDAMFAYVCLAGSSRDGFDRDWHCVWLNGLFLLRRWIEICWPTASRELLRCACMPTYLSRCWCSGQSGCVDHLLLLSSHIVRAAFVRFAMLSQSMFWAYRVCIDFMSIAMMTVSDHSQNKLSMYSFLFILFSSHFRWCQISMLLYSHFRFE